MKRLIYVHSESTFIMLHAMSFTRGQKVALSTICTVIVILLVFCAQRDGAEVKLQDGSLLSIEHVQFGGTNVFSSGNFIERTFSFIIPSNGIQVSGVALSKPEAIARLEGDGSSLAIQVRLQTAGSNAPPQTLTAPSRLLRWRLCGDKDVDYIVPFTGLTEQRSDYLGYVQTTCFPRLSKHIRIVLEKRPNDTSRWAHVAELRIRNPAQVQKQHNLNGRMTFKQDANGVEFTLKQLVVTPCANDCDSLWTRVIKATVQPEQDGIVQTNWNFYQMYGEDGIGNAGPLENLDPRTPWKVTVELASAPESVRSSICTITFQMPLTRPIKTNFAGHRIWIAQTSVSSNTLTINLGAGSETNRLTVMKIQDMAGSNVIDRVRLLDQHAAWVDLNRPTDILEMQLAVQSNVDLHYVVKPVWIGNMR